MISGTAMDVVLLRWLQDGDPGGLYRRALASFPDQDMAERVLAKYFIEGGKAKDKPYKPLQMWVMEPSQELNEISVLGNYCEVSPPSPTPFRGTSLIRNTPLLGIPK